MIRRSRQFYASDEGRRSWRPRGRFLRVLLAILCLGAVIAAGSYAVVRVTAARSARPRPVDRDIVLGFWQERDYQSVSEACDISLELEPLDPFYLTFKGFSAFYLGVHDPDAAVRGARMDEAVFAIRKALVDDAAPLRPEAMYVLGKAYYHKGDGYYDEALASLDDAVAAGIDTADAWEYLALAAGSAGLPDRSVGYFRKAVAANPEAPGLLLAAATAFRGQGDLEAAEAYAVRAASLSADDYVTERCEFLIAEIYRATGRSEQALAVYSAIRDRNPESAEAWYQEGLLYQELGDPLKARASWRKAVSIDPMHAGARQKLAERA